MLIVSIPGKGHSGALEMVLDEIPEHHHCAPEQGIQLQEKDYKSWKDYKIDSLLKHNTHTQMNHFQIIIKEMKCIYNAG